jgi:hypothetical protein
VAASVAASVAAFVMASVTARVSGIYGRKSAKECYAYLEKTKKYRKSLVKVYVIIMIIRLNKCDPEFGTVRTFAQKKLTNDFIVHWLGFV